MEAVHFSLAQVSVAMHSLFPRSSGVEAESVNTANLGNGRTVVRIFPEVVAAFEALVRSIPFEGVLRTGCRKGPIRKLRNLVTHISESGSFKV